MTVARGSSDEKTIFVPPDAPRFIPRTFPLTRRGLANNAGSSV